MSKAARKKELLEQRNLLLKRSSAGWVSFRRFLFAPNLLTFVISVVVGNAFGAAIKDLVSLIAHLLYSLWRWIFFAGHPLYFDATQTAWTSFLTSLLTMLSIALAVYYTIQFINNKLIGSESEKWGYDEPHVDMMALQKLQKENNDLVRANSELQKQILAELTKSSKE
ncbi:large-conductance mechanosensitive channel [Fructobacillus pseudoficulneus]|uniref:Large-conductance mechanosensitive channel n=1 Tax=Fructobacillus pseudoficulneus TaxID=220714 RepID=A0A3F3GX73_9LACO|nr:MscL family protein [Fructobacillus pseudoficulneus]GAP03294.1 large-conductance mechanosensitive channel [Fructobacillus pseudoficulneus]SEH44223.1 Large-conductance mechanosensitive channel [Fructobacillus pseudoficulneus]